MDKKWKVPPVGIVKINFDGGFNASESRLGGIGVIARDAEGSVLGALQTTLKGDGSFGD